MIGDDDEPQREADLPPMSETEKEDLGFGTPVTEPERLERNRKIVMDKVAASEKAAGINHIDE